VSAFEKIVVHFTLDDPHAVGTHFMVARDGRTYGKLATMAGRGWHRVMAIADLFKKQNKKESQTKKLRLAREVTELDSVLAPVSCEIY